MSRSCHTLDTIIIIINFVTSIYDVMETATYFIKLMQMLYYRIHRFTIQLSGFLTELIWFDSVMSGLFEYVG